MCFGAIKGRKIPGRMEAKSVCSRYKFLLQLTNEEIDCHQNYKAEVDECSSYAPPL